MNTRPEAIKVYRVKTAGGSNAARLALLEAADDVTCLVANETDPAELERLRTLTEKQLADGN